MTRISRSAALAAAAAALFAIACGSSTMAKVNETAYWSVPSNTKVALITVDASKKVGERAPSDFANFKAMLMGSLSAAFGAHVEIVDKTELGFKQLIAPVQKEAKKLWIFTEETAPVMPADQVWGAEAPKGLPTGVTEPLTLAVKVLAWSVNNELVGNGSLAKEVPVAHLDLVYSLWTKAGKEVETVRVVNSVNGEMRGEFVSSLPARNWRLVSDYRGADGAMGDREKVFRAAVANTGSWFSWPYLPHEVSFQAVWHTTDDRDKPAVKLADEGKWEEAFAVWKGMADADAKAAPPLYNMGVVRYVQGNRAEALAFFNKACALDDKLLYRQMRDKVVEGDQLRKAVLE